MGSTKAKYDNGILSFYDSASYEQVSPQAACVFYDDFLGTSGLKTASNGANWTAIDTGDATEALVANTANGIVALTLAATSEKEEAGISWGDSLLLLPGQGLVMECAVKATVTPTGNAEATWGLASAYAEAGDTIGNNAWFKIDGSTAILCESDNGSTDVDDTDTGVVAGTTTQRIYRIDASNAADVRYFIDGNRVCSTTTFAVAATTVQPFFYVYKASGTGVGTIQIDYVRIWQKRS